MRSHTNRITHKGSHHSGHYETFRRQHNGNTSEDASVVLIEHKGAQTSTVILDDDTKSDANRSHRRNRKAHDSRESQWWRISDDKIAQATTRQALGMNAEVYLLFYELQAHQA